MIQEKFNSNGYDLYNPFGTQWVIDLKNGTAFYGTLNDVVIYMVRGLGFNHDVVSEALEVMVGSQNNAVHFGVLKTMIYTFNKVIDLNEKAS
jgi:hypothetical protein